jgi:hypothetical protein
MDIPSAAISKVVHLTSTAENRKKGTEKLEMVAAAIHS